MALKPFKGCKVSELPGGVPPIPCGLSFKIDGIRGMDYDGAFNSTSGSPLRNKQIQEYASFLGDDAKGLDFEVIDGNPWDKNVMQAAYTAAMNTKAETNFTLWVFDDFSDPTLPFEARYQNYIKRIFELNAKLEAAGKRPVFRAVEYRLINSLEEYNAMKEEAAQLGYEGLYGKSWGAPYKHGRSTPKEAYCWKDKPWTDEEGTIIGRIEMMENTNEAELDNFGRTKRSSAAEGLVGKGVLGSFLVINPKYKDENGEPIPFRVSCGTMTMEERKRLWEEGEASQIDRLLTYKFFDFGVVDVPRSAAFKSWRDPIDTDTVEESQAG